MKISSPKDNKGFTLMELIVVVAGLATLAGLSIPAFVDSIKLNKIEQVKAVMNGYAADCLGKYRLEPDTGKFLDRSTPDQLDNAYLSTLGYTVEKSKCSHLAIRPINKNQKDYALDFRMDGDGRIMKTASPTDATVKDNRFLNSCKGWAGKNCGLSKKQKAEFERLARIAKAKAKCLKKFNTWIGKRSSGKFVSWDEKKQSCSKKVYAFEGLPVNSLEAVEKALKSKYGRACIDWRKKQRKKGVISKKGAPMTKNPECGGIKYWYHSGKEFTSKIEWTNFNNEFLKQKCISNKIKAINQKKKGKFTISPVRGPNPCGKVIWLCNGAEYTSPASYKTSKCGKPKPKPPKKKVSKKKATPDRCKPPYFKKNKRCKPEYKGWPSYSENSKQCKCP